MPDRISDIVGMTFLDMADMMATDPHGWVAFLEQAWAEEEQPGTEAHERFMREAPADIAARKRRRARYIEDYKRRKGTS